MLISEIYLSLQGEGRLVGTPSVFLRTSGCNLRCSFCDTPFTSWNPSGQQQEIAQIVAAVVEAAKGQLPPRIDQESDRTEPPVGHSLDESARHVVITGGEPMLAKGIESLCEQLAAHGFHLTIETAGSIERELVCDLMSISPKLSNSTPSVERAGAWSAKHEAARYRPALVAALIKRHDYQLKFVIAGREDLEEVEQFLAEVGNQLGDAPRLDRSKVLLMPEGIDAETLRLRASWLPAVCTERGFQFCPRRHIEWYGNKRAT